MLKTNKLATMKEIGADFREFYFLHQSCGMFLAEFFHILSGKFLVIKSFSDKLQQLPGSMILLLRA